MHPIAARAVYLVAFLSLTALRHGLAWASAAAGPLAGALLLAATVAGMASFLARRPRPSSPARAATRLADHVEVSRAPGGVLTDESLRVAGAFAAIVAAVILVSAGLLWRERVRDQKLPRASRSRIETVPMSFRSGSTTGSRSTSDSPKRAATSASGMEAVIGWTSRSTTSAATIIERCA